jgi:hypothetical protein
VGLAAGASRWHHRRRSGEASRHRSRTGPLGVQRRRLNGLLDMLRPADKRLACRTSQLGRLKLFEFRHGGRLQDQGQRGRVLLGRRDHRATAALTPLGLLHQIVAWVFALGLSVQQAGHILWANALLRIAQELAQERFACRHLLGIAGPLLDGAVQRLELVAVPVAVRPIEDRRHRVPVARIGKDRLRVKVALWVKHRRPPLRPRNSAPCH